MARNKESRQFSENEL